MAVSVYIDRFFETIHWPKWVWYLVLVYITLPLLTYILLPKLYGNISTKKRIIILVLGDLGHSPRICYHARSFSSKGWSVDLCGYLDEAPPIDLIDDENVDVHQIPIYKNNSNLPFVVFGVLKVLKQVWSIVSLLWNLRGANYILIQNPPSIPVLLLAVLFKFSTRSKLIIDWHNLGYTILSLKLGTGHIFVKISKLYEKLLSRYADINLTVTSAMKSYLTDEFNVEAKKIIVLYDKAAIQFQPISSIEKAEVISTHPKLFKNHTSDTKVIVSATSFTPDEDFNLLIEALRIYDTQSLLPNLKVIITGKGPLKSQFLQTVKESKFTKVDVQTAWLTAEEYPKIIATADVGISLHTSSSGIDLPMKVVDMFGCGLPVIALNFPALPELVQDGVNGLVVETSQNIYESIKLLFTDEILYSKVKKGALKKSKERWESNWKSNLGDRFI